MKSKLIAYAMDFASFLIQKVQQEKIRNIILFGSVARGESDKESDIDLFVDLIDEDKTLINKINICLDEFIASSKVKNYWKLLGISNEIKLTIGNLDKWNELKPSVISNGIVLYGKYKSDIKGGKYQVFFIWENIKPNTKRVLFNKQLFGFNQNEKFYPGLINKYQGEKLGKGCIIVPLEHSNIFHSLFKKYKITVKINKVIKL